MGHGIKKIAVSFSSVETLKENNGIVRTASTKIQLDETSEVSKIVKAEIANHPNALFFRAKAIQADEVNSNGDYFSESELIKSAKTFVGVPFYTNHNNQDIENARGKIVWSEWNPSEKAIYVIGFVDREAYPHICRGIEEEYMTGVSMGCQVEFSVCSICHNSASTVDDYCPHVKNLKGRKFSGKVKDAKTGEIRVARNEQVYEDNYGIRFIELSGVGDPACHSCRIQGVFDNDEETKGFNATLSKAASISNSVFMYKESSLYKDASQQEIQQLEQALQSIEQICKNLISNRKNVEMDFAADLVEILANLQKFTDELVGAGYGQLQQGGGIPGVEGDVAGAPPPMPSEEPMAPVQPVSQSAPAPSGVGSVSGAPGSSLVSAPKMPTAPIKPMSSSIAKTLEKMSKDIGKLNQIAQKITGYNSEEVEMRRRTPGIVAKELEQVRQGLNDSWQEKQAISENTQKTKSNIVAAIADNGGERMKDQITERQLDENFRYHQRDGKELNETTEKQLSGNCEAPSSVQEVQLEGKRTDSIPNQVTQKQLEQGGSKDPQSNRIEADWNEVTQARLEKQRTNTEQSSVTEKQLADSSSSWKTIWSRASFKRTEVKTAKEHVKDVLNVLAETSIDLGITPSQTHEAVSSLVDSVHSKNELLDAITEDSELVPVGLDISARAKYYGEKGIRLASVSSEGVKKAISSGLNKLVASDSKVNPEDVVLVLETLSEDAPQSVKAIASSIDARIEKSKSESVSPNRKQAFRAALAEEKACEEKCEEAKKEEAKDEEPKDEPKEATSSATHIIEATFSEVGLRKGMGKEAAKAKISGFAKGVSVSQNKKLAGITNVNVDGEKIQIAVQWDADGESQEVELSLPGSDDADLAPEAPAPEGDATGAGLDDLSSPDLAPPGAGQTPVPAVAASRGKVEKTAQVPGAGGGLPGAGPAGGAGDPALPSPMPAAADQGMQSLTEEPPPASEEETDAPGEKDLQNPPGSICPFCGSDDVDIGGKELAEGACHCNNCEATYSIAVNIEVLNPTELTFKEEKEGGEAEEPEAPESPNLPSMPVAAEVSLEKGIIQKLADLEKTHGHICPSCGTKEIKTIASTNEAVEFVCPVCSTRTTKNLLASVKDPAKGLLRVAWNVNTKKAIASGCESCKEAAMRLAADIKIAKMIKAAKDSKFPMSNCMERVARRHGLNAIATFGPCKGKPLADCVCKELEQFAITSTRKLNKLADVMMQPDDMDECLKDHMEKGYAKEAAAHICGTLKNVYASEADDNIYLLAWADETDLTAEDLRAMKKKAQAMDAVPELGQDGEIGDPIADPLADEDFSNPLPEELEKPVEDKATETVTVELPVEVAQEIADKVEGKTEEIADIELPEAPEVPEAPAAAPAELPAETGDALLAANGKSLKTAKDKNMNKEAKKPTEVKDIEHDVEAKIPRGKATIGNEGKDNIDVVEIELDIPTGKATMGDESAKNIDVPAGLPEIPTGKATMGDEAKVQKDMPGTNTEIKGTIIANIKSVRKIAKTPDHVEHIESEVEAGIPRGTATLGNEGKDNIDVPVAKPEIPRGNATLGNESAENIDVAEKQVDIPTNNQFLGHEQEIQKDMPALEVKEKGTIIAGDNREKHLKKIEQARWKKAVSLAGKLLGSGNIEEQAFDDVVEVLSRVGLDQMETYASRVFPKKAVQKQASVNAPLTQAIVQEASGLQLPEAVEQSDSLADLFTIGSKGLDENLRRFGEK